MPDLRASLTAHGEPVTAASLGGESYLGLPAADGYVLASTADGVRVWVPQGSGGSASLSDDLPLSPGIPNPGQSSDASRSDHVHAPPIADQITNLIETTKATVAAMLQAGAHVNLAYTNETLVISVVGSPPHANSHIAGGSDPIEPAAIGALPIAGGTATGPLWMPSQSGVNDVAGYAIFILDGAAGTYRELRYTTNGSPRWRFRVNNAAETGGNAGSNFQLSSHADNGDYLSAPMTIERATSNVTFTSALKAATIETSAGSKWQLAGYSAASDKAISGVVTVTIDGVARKLAVIT